MMTDADPILMLDARLIEVLTRECVSSGLLRPDSNSLGHFRFVQFLAMLYPASSCFLFFMFSTCIL